MTKVVHCKRESYHIYIGRPSIWENPFKIGHDGTRAEVIAKYKEYILSKPELLGQLESLRGKTLGCWCSPQRCHGDVLVELLETKRCSLDGDVAELKELAEVFETERIIICQRSGPGKGCIMTWAEKDKVFVSIKYSGTVAAVVRETKMEGLTQKVKVRTAVHAPLLGKCIVSDDKRWFDGSDLKPRVSIIAELGEFED